MDTKYRGEPDKKYLCISRSGICTQCEHSVPHLERACTVNAVSCFIDENNPMAVICREVVDGED
jgi:hypothetical protein